MANLCDAWLQLMRRGEFEAAWRVSDQLLGTNPFSESNPVPRHEQAVWDGSDLTGRRVLVRCYHGLGDTIQFARYLPLVGEIASHLTVWAQPPLLPLLQTMRGIDQLLPLHDGDPGVDCDVDVEIMELGHVFRTTLDTVPADVPYFDVARRQSESDGLSIGIAWRGGNWDETRSIPFALFREILDVRHVTAWALQRELEHTESDERLIVDERRRTISGTAELMSDLDLVITVDSMPAHLAGALAIPVWTLLPADSDWRWMERRSDSPWYPTMRLFRQTERGDWSDVIAEVRQKLSELAAANRARRYA